MDDCLADEDAVERIAMQDRQPRDVKRRLLVDRERRETGGLALVANEAIRLTAQFQGARCRS